MPDIADGIRAAGGAGPRDTIIDIMEEAWAVHLMARQCARSVHVVSELGSDLGPDARGRVDEAVADMLRTAGSLSKTACCLERLLRAELQREVDRWPTQGSSR